MSEFRERGGDIFSSHEKGGEGDEESDDQQERLEKVQPIEESAGQKITKENIGKFVEAPLVEACEIFYDKNIRTLSSSANKKDMERGEAHIILDVSTMSLENREIAKKEGEEIGEYGGCEAVEITIPIEEGSENEIREKSKEIANLFDKQEPKWIKKYSLEDLKNMFFLEEGDFDENNLEDLADELGFYYSSEDGFFYDNKEYYEKVKKG